MNVYRSAALALDHLDKNKGSVKGSLAAAKVQGTHSETKRVLALIIETLKYREVLVSILEVVPLQKLERETFRPKATPSTTNFLTVLLHDLLIKGKIEASDKWQPKTAIQRHQARLKAEIVRAQIKAGKSSVKELAKSAGNTVEARYVRWNPNTGLVKRKEDWSLSALEKHLATKGFKRVNEPIYPVPPKTYFMDPHLPDYLLVFPASTSWWVGDKWYESGAIILQDKASCIPAVVVMDGWEGGADGLDHEGIEGNAQCIDATAAPGNKTSLMSALMGNKGKLRAFERSPQRYQTLTRMLEKANCKNIIPTRGDFTETNPDEFNNVTRILLDPSCSGSGIVNRLDYLVENEDEEVEKEGEKERLEKLAGFQLQMILHAFKFPSVRRIVYSTCSIHPEEDERVVAAALAASGGRFRLAPRASVLPAWERRGLEAELGDKAQSVIRCLPEDKTNGFFVSCFERVGEGEEVVEEDVAEDAMEVDEPKETASKKRTREEDEPKAKTQAQIERNKRKRTLQKKKKKVTGS